MQGHDHVTIFDEFTQSVIGIFELKDEEEYFKDSSNLGKTKSVNEYVEEIKKFIFMVPNIS